MKLAVTIFFAAIHCSMAISAAAGSPMPFAAQGAPTGALAPTAVGGGLLRPGYTFKDCAKCPEMVVIPAGSFMMGSPPDEAGRHKNEGPRHQVTIRHQFAVARYEVTRGQFAQFVNDTGHQIDSGCFIDKTGIKNWGESLTHNWRNPDFAQGDKHPVVCVNWADARAYINWLRRKTGQPYRLLSEAAWEYVARADTTTPHMWGNNSNNGCRYANAADHSTKKKFPTWTASRCDDGFIYTSPVGRFWVNPFGLYDIFGNVWEWVGDCWNASYLGAPRDGAVWNSGQCDSRVLRGGSWNFEAKVLRSAKRLGYTATIRNIVFGFRIARTLGPVDIQDSLIGQSMIQTSF